MQARLQHKIEFLYFQLASPEEQILMVEPLAWRPEIPPMDPRWLLRFLRVRLAEGVLARESLNSEGAAISRRSATGGWSDAANWS
jgi:hypothetical protein